ncbi:uncharacterized protein B0I36DRAFT_347388 [Microdochium trichocladiopsis]|uniref:Uncharacterized protein n=1 Tax=Microdochium trichocladiopsis TaxID=1682393 RepID=A0A9P8YCA6_9PEZI|nr:uncharacterized protein B0I36DRAFT_347388 [Microdochium trichocladiopsis]KAH7035647.1 hypothetical protein B0I36DRAFT_347388 [Microdochium trichocladiopsis]
MAAEATATNPVDVPPTEPSSSHAAYIDSDPHNATSPSPPVNGSHDEIENKQITELVDELVQSAEVSVSGGSDTEASKSKLDDKGHARNSSTVKKPQSFKSVSVNRTFLASKGAAASTSRPDSAAGSASSTPAPGNASSSASKLKLVSKSQSGIGGSNKALGPNGKPVAPSASSVWNKNQPVPPPEPKKFTDEELQLKYGIHLADRLGPDKDSGQSNWADIDDDEEWDPDTITWTDGTHIKLPQADEKAPSPIPAPAAPVTAAAPPAPRQIEIPPKTKSPVPPTSNVSSPSIKPGVLASGKGLVLKGGPEKPVFVAKPPAPPQPAKSPWAPLPPVDKTAPIVLDAPAHGASQGYQRRDGMQTRTPPPPTKEIAADDFSRGPWRDGPNATSGRELFNSHSGRYEPVPDRRGSRPDGGYGRQQPSVLQRPSHHDTQGPAEPSAAFQTSRNSGAEGPYGRRRGSSNVSGGSGGLAYRLERSSHNIPGPHDPQHVRSGSMSGGPDVAAPPNQHGQPWQNRSSPNTVPASMDHSHAVQEPVAPVPPPVPVEDEIEVQKRLMRERREAAIKRRHEDEAREEEARKERIRKKLEAMGPAPERKSTKKDEKDATSQPAKDVPQALLARTKPADKAQANPSSGSDAKTNVSADALTPETSNQVNGTTAGQPIRPDGAETESLPQPSAAPRSQTSAPWLDAPQSAERYPSWGGNQSNSSRNVWAAPGNDRSLGNGTFIADLGHSIHNPTNPNIANRPAPIAPPRSVSQAQAANPATQSSSARLAPIGPPRGAARTQDAQQRQAPGNLWQNYDAAADDQAIREKSRAQEEARLQRLVEQGINPDHGPMISETWRAVKMEEDGRRGQAGSSVYMHSGVPGGPSDLHRSSQVAPTGPNAATAMSQSRSSSRFFPPTRDVRLDEGPMHHHRPRSPTPPPPTMEDHPAYEGNPTRPHVSLPRGPIVVKLPPAAAKPATPVAPPKPATPVSFAAAAAAAVPQAARGLTQVAAARSQGQSQRGNESKAQGNWQDKINSLMGRKAPRPTVDSTSRISMEHGSRSANVSLPSLSSASSVISDDSTYTSREMAEECFEEQEMGSLPAVHLPMKAPEAMWHAVNPNWLPLVPKYRVHATNAEPHRFGFDYEQGQSVIRVSAPGMPEVKTVQFNVASRSGFSGRTRSNPRRGGSRGGNKHTPRGGQRGGREGILEGPSPNNSTAGPSSDRPKASRGGRGSLRSRSEAWSRQPSSTPAAQN